MSAGPAILVILAGMGAGWLSRALLLRVLRHRHPDAFAGLGRPSTRQLSSLFPRFQDLQIAFFGYLWSGAVFRLKDPLASALGGAALACDVVLVVGVALLIAAAQG